MVSPKISTKVFLVWVVLDLLAGAASAQVAPYTITTIAGGGPPNGSLSTAIALSSPAGVAVDAAGNVYVADSSQNRVYKLATDGSAVSIAGTGVAGYSGDGIPAGSAQLNNPNGLALDSAGNLYIADSGNCRVRKVSGGIITTVAGTGACGYSGDNIPAGAALLNNVNAVAVDTSGNLYLADIWNYRIRKVSAAGIITTIAGTGSYGFSGDNVSAVSAQITQVYAIAVDTGGRVYFADTGTYRVRKIEAGQITTVAGNGGYGYSGDGGAAANANITWVQGVAVDTNGNLYIADSNSNRIRVVSGGLIATIAGNGSSGFSGDNGPAANAMISNPRGIVLNAEGNVYFADTSNYRVRKIVGGIISTIGGNGSYSYFGDNGPAITAQLGPQGVAVKSPGNLYVADAQNFRVRNISGGVIQTAAGTGACCYNGDGMLATNALTSANSVAVDGAGNFYVGEQARIRKVSGGIISTVAGNGASGYSGDNGPATGAQVAVTRIAADSSGNLYFADSQHNRVRKISGGVITTVAGGGPQNGASATGVSLGQVVAVASDAAGNFYVPAFSEHRVYRISAGGTLSVVAGNGSPGFSGDNGLATSAQLNNPYGVAVNSTGTVLYIADRGNNRIRMVSGGVITTVAGGGVICIGATNSVGDGCPGINSTLNFPNQLALDAAGALYIADALNYRIRKLSGGVITTVAGSGFCTSSAQGCLNLGDNGPATSAQLNYATSMAIDPTNGDLYIGDSENFRVRKVSSGTITTVAGTGSYGYNGDGIQATSAQLSYCYGVAVDSLGNLYIADAANHRIRKVSGGVITTVAGAGSYGFSGDGSFATGAQIYNPYAVALDGANNLYIADTSNLRVRKISGGIITTVAGNGSYSFSGDGGQALNAQLSSPFAVAVDSAGTLYISDLGNSRIRMVSAGGIISTVVGNGSYGYSGENVPATGPIGYTPAITVDSVGSLYLVEAGNNRIRKVVGGFISTVAGTGYAGFSGDGGPAANASLSNPQDLTIDGLGNMYVADAGNFRIRLLTMAPKTINSTVPATATAGSSGFLLTVNGSGFVNGDVIQWNGTALSTTFLNSNQLTAAVNGSQLAQPGTLAITVTGLSNLSFFSILPLPSLTASKSHSGNFTRGQTGATYAVLVSNDPAAGPTLGTITVTELIPSGLTLSSMAGAGWNCASTSCTRSDVLAGGASYPAITVTVSVALNAPALVTNQVGVSGGGSLSAGASDPTLVQGSIASADFNGDGHSDVIWQDQVSGWAQIWYLGGAQGVTTIGSANLTLQNTWRIVGVGDFDRDGKSDVVWQDPVSGAAQIWFLGGAGGNLVTSAATISGGNAWRIRAVTDFNGDGIPDCIWQDQATGFAQIWFMGGAQGTVVLGSVNLTAANTWRIAGAGDFNKDGNTDVLWQDPANGATQIWYLGGAQHNAVTSAANLTGANAWQVAAVCDYNGDGYPDTIWQDPLTGISQTFFLGGANGASILNTVTFSGPNTWRISGPR